MMEEVGIGDAIDCRIHCNGEAKHGGDVFEAVSVRQLFSKGSTATYRVVTRGIMAPLVMVSTRRINGIMDKTL